MSPPSLGTPLPKAKILIVDDNLAKLKAIEAILSPLNETLVCVNDGIDALRQVLTTDFALILIDVKMPGMDGLETAHMIRQRQICLHIPIIFLTAFSEGEIDMQRGYALGAVDYVFAPIVPEILRAKVTVFIDLHHKAQQIEALYAQAYADSLAKSEFLNMAAHELRTPLSVISGYLAMFNDGSLGKPPPAWKIPLDLLNLKSAELNKIIDDLLLTSKMESGHLQPKIETFDLNDCVKKAIERAQGRTNLLKGTITFKPNKKKALVRGDFQQIGKIIDNLINNSLTYCSLSPHITIGLISSNSHILKIIDNGIGVLENNKEAIFEKFVRIDNEDLGFVPGTGLGLYISQNLAQRNKAQLTLLKTSKKGSTFQISFPIAQFTQD